MPTILMTATGRSALSAARASRPRSLSLSHSLSLPVSRSFSLSPSRSLSFFLALSRSLFRARSHTHLQNLYFTNGVTSSYRAAPQQRSVQHGRVNPEEEENIWGAEPMGTNSLFMPRLTATDVQKGQVCTSVCRLRVYAHTVKLYVNTTYTHTHTHLEAVPHLDRRKGGSALTLLAREHKGVFV